MSSATSTVDPPSSNTDADPKTDVERAEVTEAQDAMELLDLVSVDSPYHPIHWSLWKRWWIATVYCTLQLFVMIMSTEFLSLEGVVAERWGGSTQVLTMGQSMFVAGTAFGPIVLGPASDLIGRKYLYVIATFLYGLVNIGVALPTGLPMLIIFMLLAGITGSVSLCNAAGTIADLFGDDPGAGQAMALFVLTAYMGPSLGSPIGEWLVLDPNLGFPWMGWLNVIIALPFALLMLLIPETLPRLVIGKALQAKSAAAGAPVPALPRISFSKEVWFVITMAFKILVTEPIVQLLAFYNGFVYGLLFLYLDGVFDVFVFNNGLSDIVADLTFLNIGVGVVLMFIFLVPLQTWLVKRDRAQNGGKTRPEARFLLSLVCVWGFPISLFWFAFTSTGNVSYWSPLIAGTLLGIVDPLLWLSMLSYLTDAYPNAAGSALAAFLVPSFLIAAGCAHIGVVMFDKLTTKVAVAILAGFSVGVVGLVYVIYFWGEKLRRRSRYAKAF